MDVPFLFEAATLRAGRRDSLTRGYLGYMGWNIKPIMALSKFQRGRWRGAQLSAINRARKSAMISQMRGWKRIFIFRKARKGERIDKLRTAAEGQLTSRTTHSSPNAP